MLRQNEWYTSFSDWTCIYEVLIKRKYPALVYHVVRRNEEEEDFCKTMFNYLKRLIYGHGKNFYL